MANRLAEETSPYLLQHAQNPVDWYPWGTEAFAAARAQDRPIFLSIGYSACHWCHVMAHESFEDERTAEVLNGHFVSIKVDREERPDLDRIYMGAVQAMTGSGGWPMSAFITADGLPFYGGTYFPPEPRQGMPAFTEVLLAVAAAWQGRRDELLDGSERVRGAIEANAAVPTVESSVETSVEMTLAQAVDRLSDRFDARHGGWGSAPKFPQPMSLEFLLRYYLRTGQSGALSMVEQTLEAMARGGVYDQIGGGFHRYSVDARWLVPHFEKMLYDNALLARVYLHAWQVTGRSLYRAVAEQTLDYVMREMTGPSGEFYATQDADSEGKEGAFYVWTPAEVTKVLGPDAEAFLGVHGASDAGNFEGRNILEYVGALELRGTFAHSRRTLLGARERREHPHRDGKVLASWNGLMLAAFAEAARVLGREDYLETAKRSATFLTSQLVRGGRLYHVWTEGSARLNGYLEDHVNLAEGLIEVYQTTHDVHWFEAAENLLKVVRERFGAPVGYYDTSDDHEALIMRPRELQDNAVPSGNATAALVTLRLAGLNLSPGYEQQAAQMLASMQPLLAQHPLAFAQWLAALEQMAGRDLSVAIAGIPGTAEVDALLQVVRAAYRPNMVVAVGEPDAPGLPLLRYREKVGGAATAYVCVGRVCQAPVTDPAALRDLFRSITVPTGDGSSPRVGPGAAA